MRELNKKEQSRKDAKLRPAIKNRRNERREESKKARGDHNSRHLLALARHYQRRHRRGSGMMSRGIKQRDVRPAWNSRKYIHQARRVISTLSRA